MAFQTPGNASTRGVQNHSGGAFDQSAQQDVVDGDSFQGPLTQLFGVAANPDAINPHVSGNYMIMSAAVDPITLGVPITGGPSVGGDDGVSINIWSDTAFAHTVTLPSAKFARGSAGLATVGTFTAQRGAGCTLRAWNGTWQVVGVSNVAFA
jgi:hypothetical protein